MRYSGEAGLLEQRWQNARPLLIVEGNLAGPDHEFRPGTLDTDTHQDVATWAFRPRGGADRGLDGLD